MLSYLSLLIFRRSSILVRRVLFTHEGLAFTSRDQLVDDGNVIGSTRFSDIDVALTIVGLGVRYHTSLSWQKSIFRLASCSRRLSTMKSVTQPLMPRWLGLPPTKTLPLVVSNVVSIEILTGIFSSIWIVHAFRRLDARIWWKTPSSTLSWKITQYNINNNSEKSWKSFWKDNHIE